MSAKKLFGIVMGAIAYILITALWFIYVVPAMLRIGTEAALIVAGFGLMIWGGATSKIIIYIIQKARPA